MGQGRFQTALFAGLASVIVAGSISVSAAAHAYTCVNGTVQRGGSGGLLPVPERRLVARRADVRPEQCRRLWPKSAAAAEVCEVSGSVHVPD